MPRVEHVDWTIHEINFDKRMIRATAALRFDKSGITRVDLNGLEIESVHCFEAGKRVPRQIVTPDQPGPFGSYLLFHVGRPRTVHIVYRTSIDPSKCRGLDWMGPEHTTDKRGGFLVSQSQQINGRTFMPIQDTPQVRFTMHTVVEKMPVYMSAVLPGELVSGNDGSGRAEWKLKKPIPMYLVSIAVGVMDYRWISNAGRKVRLWAEPSQVAVYAGLFEKTPEVIQACEEIMGIPYPWGKELGLLVLPKSYWYGAMENVQTIFLSPTATMVDVYHEIAHMWTGNYVTPASAEHLWLSEGPTSLLEYALLRRFQGEDEAQLWLYEYSRNWQRSKESINPDLQMLNPDLHDVDPDVAYNMTPYYKGLMLLLEIAKLMGSLEGVLKFLAAYVDHFEWQSITSHQFSEFLHEQHPAIAAHIDFHAWYNEPGIPDSAPQVLSRLADEVQAALAGDGLYSPGLLSERQIVVLLGSLNGAEMSESAVFNLLITLAHRFDTSSVDLPIPVRAELARIVVDNGTADRTLMAMVEALLHDVGRGKYVKGLYRSVLKRPGGAATAKRWMKEVQPFLHPIGQQVVEQYLKEASQA